MLMIIQANGAALKTDLTKDEFFALISQAAPSSWVSVKDTELGDVLLNTFTVAYVYEA